MEVEKITKNIEDLDEMKKMRKSVEDAYTEMEESAGESNDEVLDDPMDGKVSQDDVEALIKARQEQVDEELKLKSQVVSREDVDMALSSLETSKPAFRIGNVCFQVDRVDKTTRGFYCRLVNPVKPSGKSKQEKNKLKKSRQKSKSK